MLCGFVLFLIVLIVCHIQVSLFAVGDEAEISGLTEYPECTREICIRVC